MAYDYRYTAYGLAIHSGIPLPELLESERAAGAPPDVVIRLGAVERRPDELERPYGYAFLSQREAYFVHDLTGTILVRDGSEIVVDAAGHAEEPALRNAITNIAMGVLLHQRGIYTLHASGVALGARAYGIVGEKGQGKSTTAAGLHARGNALITDEVLAVRVGAGEDPAVLPSYPQLKLFPDALDASVGADPASLGQVHSSSEKRLFGTQGRFGREAIPLGAIFVLADGPEIAIRRLSPQAAFVELVRHSYTSGILDGTATAGRHLQQSAEIIRRVPVCALERPRALHLLPRLLDRIEDFARAEAGSA